jgi:hypothetical protein
VDWRESERSFSGWMDYSLWKKQSERKEGPSAALVSSRGIISFVGGQERAGEHR